MGFVCCVCKENQSVEPNIETALTILGEQAELPQELDITAALANDPALAEGEQFEPGAFPFNETFLPENEQSFQFQEEHLQNISLEKGSPFCSSELQ